MPRTAAQVRALLAPREHSEQARVFDWAELFVVKWPELGLLHATPNQGRAGGRKGVLWGVRMKREGLRAGVPDIHLPVARGPYIGFYGETKRTVRGTVSKAQKWWIERLTAEGHLCVVGKGAEPMIYALIDYLKLPKREQPSTLSQN